MIVIAVVLGLFDGCLMSQIEPIANELSRIENAFAAKICFFTLGSIPIAVGPTLAGNLYSLYKANRIYNSNNFS